MECRGIPSELYRKDLEVKYYYYYIVDEVIARISSFCRAAERHFQSLAGPKNVSVDLKYDVLCL